MKACKDLGIKLIPAIMREELIDEDEKLKILLAANFGRTKNNEAKQRKIAVEYVNLCGNKHGGDRASGDNRRLKLDEIAVQLGTNERSLRELLSIERKLTPEMKELIYGGSISKTTAAKRKYNNFLYITVNIYCSFVVFVVSVSKRIAFNMTWFIVYFSLIYCIK